MIHHRTQTKCRRVDCKFNRMVTISAAGVRRPRKCCSASCEIWERRARRIAGQDGPEAEAEARVLLELLARLDARTSPDNSVPEIFTTP
ncbi:hypothetical protein [Streptomyces lydicus]|uniref:hypothetical protein n=1 Tax=Streptomyces lydicus TaxID=47763 RepID=UPI0037953EA4